MTRFSLREAEKVFARKYEGVPSRECSLYLLYCHCVIIII